MTDLEKRIDIIRRWQRGEHTIELARNLKSSTAR